MKICLINHCLDNGGTDTFVINAAKGLKKCGNDVTVIMAVDDDGIKHFREQEALDAGVKVLRTCDLNGIKKKLLHCKKLYSILKRERYDVVHSNMDLFNGINLTVAWLAKIPVRVCHSHTSMSQYEERTGKHLSVSVYRFIMRKLCRLFSNRRCGCSETAMEYLFGNRWKKDKNSRVIYNGIDLTKYRDLISTDEKKKEIGVSSDTKIISVIGRISDVKNPRFVVEVIRVFAKIRNDFELVWVGTGELQKEIQQLIRDSGTHRYIHMIGRRDDVNEILQCSDAFFMPSKFEGLPFALVEAQAAGLTCLVSDAISPMSDCGGCVFMPLRNSADEWARKLSDILDGKEKKTIDKDKIKRFDVNFMIQQLEEIYEQ